MAEQVRRKRGKRLSYYEMYPADFISDPRVNAMHPIVENCYRRLLDNAWIQGQSGGDIGLRDDDVFLAGCCRVTKDYFKKRVRPVLIDGPDPVFVRRDDGRLINKRLVAEYESALERSGLNSRAAKSRWSHAQDGEGSRENQKSHEDPDEQTLADAARNPLKCIDTGHANASEMHMRSGCPPTPASASADKNSRYQVRNGVPDPEPAEAASKPLSEEERRRHLREQAKLLLISDIRAVTREDDRDGAYRTIVNTLSEDDVRVVLGHMGESVSSNQPVQNRGALFIAKCKTVARDKYRIELFPNAGRKGPHRAMARASPAASQRNVA